MSPPKWDDDFDFEDIDQPKNKKKVPESKKVNAYDDEFFDDNNSKLPVINKNNIVSSKQIPPKKNSVKLNPYGDKADFKKNIYEDLYEQQIAEEPIESSPKGKQNNDPKNKIKPNDDEDYYEDIDDIPETKNITAGKPMVNSQKNLPVEDSYGEEEFDDVYGEGFEEIQIEEPQKIIPKPVQKKEEPPKKQTLPLKQKQQPPKPPSRSRQKTQPQRRNLTMAKPQKAPLERSVSRKSLKSVNSQRGETNNKPAINKISANNSFAPQKYSNQIAQAFPTNVNLNDIPQDKLSKMNDRVRAMIKRFNEELNNLINKNMLYLKAKKKQKSSTVEEKLRVYEQQKKNNEAMIQYMQRQFDKLCGREGELKEEEYQLLTEKKIQETKQLIKQAHKAITKLKYEVKNQGNKLTKQGEDKRLNQELHHLKTTLIQAKKDEEKHNEKLTKLDQQSEDLDGKIADVDYKLNELIQKAKEKGIPLETNEKLKQQYEDFKKKIEHSRVHRTKLQNLLKTKSDIIVHEKQQIRINIKNSEMEIKNLYESIGHSHQQSTKVVEKAKNNPKINPNIVNHLDQILKTLEQAQQFDSFSVRSDNKSQASERPHGTSEAQIVNNKLDKADDSTKPNLLKKKPKVVQAEERIWKDDQHKQENQKPAEIKKPVQQEDKKKPFSLKRNKFGSENKISNDNFINNKNEENLGGLKLDVPDRNVQKQEEKKDEKTQEKKEEEPPSITGPRMMKFRKKNNGAQEKTLDSNISKEITQQFKEEKNEITNNIQQKQEETSDIKPFVPKRFNLRNRQQQKKQEAYIPSIGNEEKKQEKKEERKEEVFKIPEKKQPQKKVFNLDDVVDPYAVKKQEKNIMIAKQPDNKISIPSLEKQEEQIKPKFTLRLRDRKKNENENQYAPSGNSQKVIEKPEVVDNKYNPYTPSGNQQKVLDKPEVVENKYNPYAPAQKQEQSLNPYSQQSKNQVPRRKQGPIKKTKPVLNAPKQKINIYEQAEQAQGLNQFVNGKTDKKEDKGTLGYNYNNQTSNQENKDVGLNQLLGLNKKQKAKDDDLTDLLGGSNIKPKNNKKKNEFFGDLDF